MYTDIGSSAQGNNKFYVIQVLQGKGKFCCWSRWGRLGEAGQSKLQEYANLADAGKDFEKKFQDKVSAIVSFLSSFTPPFVPFIVLPMVILSRSFPS